MSSRPTRHRRAPSPYSPEPHIPKKRKGSNMDDKLEETPKAPSRARKAGNVASTRRKSKPSTARLATKQRQPFQKKIPVSEPPQPSSSTLPTENDSCPLPRNNNLNANLVQTSVEPSQTAPESYIPAEAPTRKKRNSLLPLVFDNPEQMGYHMSQKIILEGTGVVYASSRVQHFKALVGEEVSPYNGTFDPSCFLELELERIKLKEIEWKVKMQRHEGNITVSADNFKKDRASTNQFDIIQDWEPTAGIIIEHLKARRRNLLVELLVIYKKVPRQIEVNRLSSRPIPPLLPSSPLHSSPQRASQYNTSDSEREQSRKKYRGYQSPQRQQFSNRIDLVDLDEGSSSGDVSEADLASGKARNTKTNRLKAQTRKLLRANPQLDKTNELIQKWRCTKPGCGNHGNYCYISWERGIQGSHFALTNDDVGKWSDAIISDPDTYTTLTPPGRVLQNLKPISGIAKDKEDTRRQKDAISSKSVNTVSTGEASTTLLEAVKAFVPLLSARNAPQPAPTFQVVNLPAEFALRASSITVAASSNPTP